MTNEIEIRFDYWDVKDNYRFAANILEVLIKKGLPTAPGHKHKNPIRIVAEHIRDTLGFNGCRVVHEKFGAGTITFYKT